MRNVVVLLLGMALAACTGGDGVKEYETGKAYFNGAGVEQSDTKAVEWFRKSAEKGYAPGQNFLGWMYYKGRGVKQDYKQAAAWYRKAAEQGFARAQTNLGWMYEEGRGVKQDYKKAVDLSRKGAEGGNAMGVNNLGVMYEYGRSLWRDREAAYDLYRIAAARADEEKASSKARSNLYHYDTATMRRGAPETLRRALMRAWLELVNVGDSLPAVDGQRPLLAKGAEIFGLGDYESALEILEQSREMEGDSSLLNLYLAASRMALGQDEQALADVRRALGQDAKMDRMLLAVLLLRRGADDFSELKGWKPAGTQSLFVRGLIRLRQKKPGEAVTLLKQMLEKQPQAPLAAAARSALAEAYFWSRYDMKRALKSLDAAISASPSQGLYRMQRAWLHYLRGDYGKAVADATRAIELEPEHPLGYRFRARAYHNMEGAEAQAEADEARVQELQQAEAQ